MSENLKYPYKIAKVDSKTNDEITELFKGITDGINKVGKYQTPCDEDLLKSFYNVEVRSDDIWIVTYTRAGTTLTQELIWQVVNYDLDSKKNFMEKFSFMEFPVMFNRKDREEIKKNFMEKGVDAEGFKEVMTPTFEKLPKIVGRRFIKSHLPFSHLPPDLLTKGCKVVYVARNPRDLAVSKFFHDRQLLYRQYVGDFKTYWKLFEREVGPDQPYWEQILEAWQDRNNPNVLFLFYENIVKNVPQTIRKLSEFLNVPRTEEQVAKLTEHVKVENMRNNPIFKIPFNEFFSLATSEYVHVRKGKSGGWKDYFDEEITESSEKWLKEKYSKTDLRFPGDEILYPVN